MKMRYSRQGLQYSQRKQKFRKDMRVLKDAGGVDPINIMLFVLLAVVVVMFVFF